MMRKIKVITLLIFLAFCFVLGYHWEMMQVNSINYPKVDSSLIKEEPNQALSKIENNKEGIYYFGYDSCPWCQELLPVLEDVLLQEKKRAYSIDVTSSHFTEKEKARLQNIFHETQKGDLQVPFLLVVTNEGQVRSHLGTVEEHDAYKAPLTNEQKNQLKATLLTLMRN